MQIYPQYISAHRPFLLLQKKQSSLLQKSRMDSIKSEVIRMKNEYRNES